MKRVRISTTVDAERLALARTLIGLPDSQVIDEALRVLVDQIEGERELAALRAHPYEGDPDLSPLLSSGPALDYHADIPPDVEAMAERRRRALRK
jgi:hypothetical protein